MTELLSLSDLSASTAPATFTVRVELLPPRTAESPVRARLVVLDVPADGPLDLEVPWAWQYARDGDAVARYRRDLKAEEGALQLTAEAVLVALDPERWDGAPVEELPRRRGVLSGAFCARRPSEVRPRAWLPFLFLEHQCPGLGCEVWLPQYDPHQDGAGTGRVRPVGRPRAWCSDACRERSRRLDKAAEHMTARARDAALLALADATADGAALVELEHQLQDLATLEPFTASLATRLGTEYRPGEGLAVVARAVAQLAPEAAPEGAEVGGLVDLLDLLLGELVARRFQVDGLRFALEQRTAALETWRAALLELPPAPSADTDRLLDLEAQAAELALTLREVLT